MTSRVYTVTAVLLIVCGSAIAEDITTRDGKTYQNVTVKRIEPDGITYSHSAGIAKLFFWELPSEIGKAYGYDPKKATEYRAAVARNQAAFARQQELAFKAQMAERGRNLQAIESKEAAEEQRKKDAASARAQKKDMPKMPRLFMGTMSKRDTEAYIDNMQNRYQNAQTDAERDKVVQDEIQANQDRKQSWELQEQLRKLEEAVRNETDPTTRQRLLNELNALKQQIQK